eukprot:CAMPEP_0168211820 /NCGR_PEP_ID=MMETSP0140_2-20121125/3926_1 /TAXON_ID=44445 /ORGANISM="Pseudo-nitzschia australis, Strain 10249 10 AB" /LENGTH=192 /DNA_ID=CAMNT_0008138551 /DNA_START=465 /DNA_END=1040 /DNA_ORIENTATION=-
MIGYYRFKEEEGHICHYEEDTLRTIRRTFSFDEWEDEWSDEETKMKKATEIIVGSRSNTDGAETTEVTTENPHDFGEEKQRIIRRTFAFDEWDNEVAETLLVDEVNNERSFRPIYNGDNEDDRKTTKFDIDNIHTTTTTTTITPSPASNKFPRTERPFPVYSSQTFGRTPPSSLFLDSTHTQTSPFSQQHNL